MRFLSLHLDAMTLYHSRQDLVNILAAGETKAESVSTELRRVVGESMTGKAMFGQMWVKASRHFFREEIRKGLDVLVDCKFLVSEVESFRRIMKMHTAELVKIGHKKYAKVLTKMQIYGQTIEVTIETPEDEFEWRMSCLLKTACVNSMQLKILPWEALLWEPGQVPEAPLHLQVDPSLLTSIANARDQARDFLDDADCTTMADMVLTLQSKALHLRRTDKSFDCDLYVIKKHAESLLKSKVQNMVLQWLPSEDHTPGLKDAILATLKLQRTEAFLATTQTVQGEIKSVTAALSDLQADVGGVAHNLC
jgi:hypothetical protein